MEQSILAEIQKGLEKDVQDMELNIKGHRAGLNAAQGFLKTLQGDTVPSDSVMSHYFMLLRGFVSLQYVSGYEVLKSKGFEVVRNDSLRSAIVDLYVYNYQFLQKLEEEYDEMKFHREYRHDLEDVLATAMEFNEQGKYKSIKQPLQFTTQQRARVLLNLSMISVNRNFALVQYDEALAKARAVKEMIRKELGE